MKITEQSCEAFVEVLASKEPVPGGGGASALVGAVGAALGHMVGSLTAGKKKYADVQDDILQLNAKSDSFEKDLLALVDRDAETFAPLSRAYGLPKETSEQQAEKARVMEKCLRECCEAPLAIMEKCCEAIAAHAEYAQKGTAIAISDVGVGVIFCKAALMGASLNVRINTKAMSDRDYAETLNQKAAAMLNEYTARADAIYEDVAARLK
ncbi:MAG: cyclodeaminase/cyclohydrolase family protein [Clostridiales bacterium]|jgi:formiminotetrahydrofolate cyclodeaminase|nr:cyclodeaminase/cyclohydrolase family protein [Clostridiales bacterium]